MVASTNWFFSFPDWACKCTPVAASGKTKKKNEYYYNKSFDKEFHIPPMMSSVHAEIYG
jgi:hypothetical protein